MSGIICLGRCDECGYLIDLTDSTASSFTCRGVIWGHGNSKMDIGYYRFLGRDPAGFLDSPIWDDYIEPEDWKYRTSTVWIPRNLLPALQDWLLSEHNAALVFSHDLDEDRFYEVVPVGYAGPDEGTGGS